MLTSLGLILPVFLIIAAGYVALRTGYMTQNFNAGLNYYAQKIAIPCLLFLAVAQLDLGEIFELRFFASYYIPATIMFAIGIAMGRVVFDRRPGGAVAVGFTVLFSNSVLLGLPITERAFGTEALAYNYAIIAFHAPFCYLVGITVMEFAHAEGRAIKETLRVTVRAMFSNQLALAILAGFIVNLGRIPLPEVALDALTMLRNSALPVAVFGLGGSLAQYNISRNIPEILCVSVLKLLVFPALVYLFGTMVFPLETPALRAAVITAAMAPGINAFIFANMYDRATGTAAGAVVFATVASIVSSALWLYVLGV